MLGIIVLNYNTYEKSIGCINSIINTINIKYRIYLVDNCSPNGSYNILKETFDGNDNVITIKSNSNLGYAKGNNLGIESALEDNCEVLLITNNDIIYHEKTIDVLYKEMKARDAFITAPKVFELDGSIQRSIKFTHPSYEQYLFEETSFSKLHKQLNFKPNSETCQVYWVAGCCFMVDSKKFSRIGFFDNNTFLFYEEYILAKKAERYKYELYYIPNVDVLHFHGSSVGKLNIVAYIACANSEKYYILNYTNWGKLRSGFILFLRKMDVVLRFGRAKKWDCVRQYLKSID